MKIKVTNRLWTTCIYKKIRASWHSISNDLKTKMKPTITSFGKKVCHSKYRLLSRIVWNTFLLTLIVIADHRSWYWRARSFLYQNKQKLEVWINKKQLMCTRTQSRKNTRIQNSKWIWIGSRMPCHKCYKKHSFELNSCSNLFCIHKTCSQSIQTCALTKNALL